MVIADSLFAAEPGLLGSPAVKVIAWIVGLLAVLGIAWGASTAIDAISNRQRRNKASQPSAGNVFDDLCIAQNISDDTKRLLHEGAAELQLDSPATLFVDSGLLKKLAASDREDASDFGELVEQLFPSATKPTDVEQSEEAVAMA